MYTIACRLLASKIRNTGDTEYLDEGFGKPQNVSDGIGKVSDGLGKLSDGLRKVLDGLWKVLDGIMKVLDGQGKVYDDLRNV